MTDLTVVYYTNNRERSAFAEKVQAALLHAKGETPLISVSQQPMDLGTNICVGEIGVSIFNAWRQFQIGAAAASTRFVCAAESDNLYPPEYFQFQPERDDTFYVPEPLYIFFAQTKGSLRFRLKTLGIEGATVVNRDFLLHRMKEMFEGLPEWSAPDVHRLHLFAHCAVQRFPTAIPTVTIKTDDNVNQRTHHESGPDLYELPHLGTVEEMRRTYL